MARNVTDAAVLLGAMTGVDPNDPATAEQVGHAFTDYTQFLDADALEGARIGVWREGSFESTATGRRERRRDHERHDRGARSGRRDDRRSAPSIPIGDWAMAPSSRRCCASSRPTSPSYLRDVHRPRLSEDAPGPDRLQQRPSRSSSPERPSRTGTRWSSTSPRRRAAGDAALRRARAIATPGAQAAIDDLMAADDLDAIIAPTNGPAWVTDPVNGDLGGDFSTFIGSSSPPAVAGYADMHGAAQASSGRCPSACRSSAAAGTSRR